MAKTTGIDMSVVLELITLGCTEYNLTLEEKAGWYALRSGSGYTMYFAKQKKCRRIDLSGFGKDFVGTIPLIAPNGRVQSHVNLDHEYVVQHIIMMMEYMSTLPKEEKVKKSFTPRLIQPLRTEAGPVATLPDSLKEERMSLIRRVAAEKGVSFTE